MKRTGKLITPRQSTTAVHSRRQLRTSRKSQKSTPEKKRISRTEQSLLKPRVKLLKSMKMSVPFVSTTTLTREACSSAVISSVTSASTNGSKLPQTVQIAAQLLKSTSKLLLIAKIKFKKREK